MKALTYQDDFGIESLSFAHGLAAARIDSLPGAPLEVKRSLINTKEIMQLRSGALALKSWLKTIMNRAIESKGGRPLYQLKIVLQWSAPAIWRQVVVRADMRLNRLHDLIQGVMPWTNSHMHQFIVGRTIYGSVDGETGGMADTLDEKKHTLAEIAPAAKMKFIYEYDFGDSWQHVVTVEKVLPPDAGFKHPICLAGANACPPDDCGGIGGYYHMLEVLAQPKHPEYDDFADWLDEGWDAARFNLAQTNAALKRLRTA